MMRVNKGYSRPLRRTPEGVLLKGRRSNQMSEVRLNKRVVISESGSVKRPRTAF